MAKIAFLGLGAMGSRMVPHLIAGSHELVLWNRNAAKAAAVADKYVRIAASPRQAARDAEFVIAMLRDDEASRHVWLDPDEGALAGLSARATAIECSTLSLDWTRTLAQQCRSRDVSFLDAPLAGSRPQAEARQLIFTVGGETETVHKAEPVLLAMGAALHHAGPTGSGMALKLALNALFAIQVAAMAELIGMLRRQGLDPVRATEIMGTTPVCSPAAKVAAQMMLAEVFAPLFPIKLVAKDLGYALAAAGLETTGPMIAAAEAVYGHALAQGLGGDHLTSIVQLYRDAQ